MRDAIGAMPTMGRLLATSRLATSRTAFASLLALAVSLILGIASAHAGDTVTKVTLVMTDLQGNVLMTKDTQGHILARYTYRPYGTQQSGPTNKGPGYTGHVNDPATGLVYMQQRYYDPAVGRFISPDPVVPAPGSIFSFGRYVYANNNPTVNIDPDGRCVGAPKDKDAPCDPEPTQPPPPVTQPPPEPTQLPTVTVTALAPALPIGGGYIRPIESPALPRIPWLPIARSVLGKLYIPIMALWPTKMGAAPCEMPGATVPCGYHIMYSKGGKQNVRDTGLIGVSDEEINRRLRDPSTPPAEKKRLQKEQKARGQRNRRKRAR